MTLLVATGTARARLLLSESPLESLAALEVDGRRLEFTSSYYGAAHWAGMRHQLRFAGARGGALSWTVALPWLYSSYANGGRAGRDNLALGGGLRLLGSEGPQLRLGAEFWLPFAGSELVPLGERRAFGRLSLLVGGNPRAPVHGALSWRRELRGLGPQLSDAEWPERWDLELRVGRLPAAGLGLFAGGGGALQFDESTRRELGWAGAGGRFAWADAYSVELAGELWMGLGGDPLRPDYRVRLCLRRDVIVAAPETATPPDPPPAQPVNDD